MKKTLSLATALTLSLGITAAAQAAFINGSLSFTGDFTSIPGTIVNDANFFDIASVLATTGTGDFFGISGSATSFGDLDLNNPATTLYGIGGFSFDLTEITGVTRTPLSCQGGLCTDDIKVNLKGIVSGNGYDPTIFLGTWTGNGSCGGSGSSCTSPPSASWSSSLTAIGQAPQPVPAPGALAMLGLGMIGFGAARRKARKA